MQTIPTQRVAVRFCIEVLTVSVATLPTSFHQYRATRKYSFRQLLQPRKSQDALRMVSP